MTIRLPDVPQTTSEMRQFLLAIKVAVEGMGTTLDDAAEVISSITPDVDDGLDPNAPTALTATSALGGIQIAWHNSDDTDLKYVEIWENTVNVTPNPDTDTAMRVGTVISSPGTDGKFFRTGIAVGQTRSYFARSVDTFGRASPFTASATITVVPVATADLSTTLVAGYNAPTGLGVTSGLATNTDGLQIVSLNISWNAVVNATQSFYEVGVIEAGGSEVVFPTSNNFLLLRARGSTAYNVRVRGVDRNGNRTGWSATVNHTSVAQTIGPAAAINAQSTLIDPGKVLISGASTLSSWRDGGDNTLITGGKIAANTVAANKLLIGARGVDIGFLTFEPNTTSVGSGVTSTNWVAWTAGQISYVDDNGTPQNIVVSSGTVQFTGAGNIYIYWTKGASTLTATTSSAAAYGANNIVLCIYAGGTALFATYGKTIIEGDSIRTGTVNADRLVAGSITTNLMSANSINGDRITAGTLDAAKITAGSLTAAQIAANTITAAKIAAGTITATEIVAAGISNLYTNSYSGTGPFLNAGDTDLLSKAYTSGDDDIVMILFNIFYINSDAVYRFGNVKVWRDVSGGGSTQLTYQGSGLRNGVGTWFASFAVDEPPANSTVSYRLTGDTDGTTVQAITAILSVARWRR